MAAASMSISLSTTAGRSKLPSAVTRCFPLPFPLPDDGALVLSLATLCDLDFERASGVRVALDERGERVCSTSFSGAGTGGSSGLWMVRARFAAGGANIEENKLCAADAVTAGGGAMEPFRAPDRDCPPDIVLPVGLPGSLKKLAVRLLLGVCLPVEGSWESSSLSVWLVVLLLTLKLAYKSRARRLRASCRGRTGVG